METHEHTEYEPADYEHTEDERSEREHTESASEQAEDEEDEHADEDEPTEADEHTEYGSSEYEYTDEYGNIVYHTNEFRMSAAGALIRNQLKGPGMKLVELQAKSGERLGVASAKVLEKLSHAGSSIEYSAYSVIHPFHPIRRRAAKDALKQKKSLATDRRRERVGAIKSHAAAKIAKAREGRIQTLEEGVN